MKIAVILVTYNRIGCLKKAIEQYEKQIYKPSHLIVVNNASKDGTRDFLDLWKKEKADFEKIVIHNTENIGGSGGFYMGMKKAMDIDCDFMFLADDDAYSEDNVFLEIMETYKKIPNKNEIAALCTTVINKGKTEISHRCNIKKDLFFIRLRPISENEYIKETFRVDIATFVGAMIKKSVVDKIGLPEKDYFIFYDDTEYFMRISKIGKTLCIPKSRMIHDTDPQRYNSWKGYYDTRNWIFTIAKHYSKLNMIGAIIHKYLRRCSILSVVVKGRNLQYREMCITAINDAINGRMGINKKYFPGN